MILQDGGSITGRQKQFIIKDQFQDTRSKSETRNKDQLCSQNNIMSSSCCRAQQRLMNLTNSKIKDVQPKLLTDASISKKSVFSEPPFIYKVRNCERIKTSKTERKLRNADVIDNGYYEYYSKEHISSRDLNIKKTIENNYKKPNENCIEEQLNNQLQTTKREKKPFNYKDFGNSFLKANEKSKISVSFEKDSYINDNNSTSENKELTDSTLKSFQEWFDKYEPAVSKSTANQVTAKPRPLKISEALEMHERENEINLTYKADSSNKNNMSKSSFFSLNNDKIPKFENLKISELHENILVANLENPLKTARNFYVEDKIDCNNQVPSVVFRADDVISEFLSCDNVSPRFTGLPKDSLSRASHDSFTNKNNFNSVQKFSFSPKNNKKEDIQRSGMRNIESQTDMCKKKRNVPTKNNFTNSRNRMYNCNKSKSLLSLDCSNEINNNRFTGLSNKDVEKRNPKATSFRSSENLLSSRKNYSVDTKNSFISEEHDVESRNNKGFQQWSVRNHQPESSRFTSERLFTRKSEIISSRSYLSSQFNNGKNDKRFSDSCLPTKDCSAIKKLPHSKPMPSKSDVNYSNRNSCSQSVPRNGFHQKRQNKALSNSQSGSALTSVNPILKETAKISRLPSSKDLSKKYNTSNREQTFKYAKNHSDINAILKSSYKNPAGKDSTQNYSCLAQQRLLCCKASKS